MSYPPVSGPSYSPDPYSSPSSGSAAQAGYGSGYQGAYAGAPYQQPTPQAPYQAAPQTPYQAAPQTPYQGAPQPAAPRGRKGPLVLLLSGVAATVLALVLVGVGVSHTMSVSGSFSRLSSNGSTVAVLNSGTTYGLYGNGRSSCTVSSPGGDDVRVAEPKTSNEINGRTLLASFTPDSSGDHTITCSTSGGSPLYIGKAINNGTMLVGAAGLLLGAVAFPVLLAGFIWLMVRNSKNRKAIQAQIAARYNSGYAGGPSQPYAY